MNRQEMTLDEARVWVTTLPWRQIQIRKQIGEVYNDEMPDVHEYVISGWAEVPADRYWAFVELVKREGYRGQYVSPNRVDPRPLVNHYLVIPSESGENFYYWTVPPKQICRSRHRQHEPLPEQGQLPLDPKEDG
ncbi:MAG: hypothetical protein ACRDMH_00380 [Solirubrobacterales bacterium]